MKITSKILICLFYTSTLVAFGSSNSSSVADGIELNYSIGSYYLSPSLRQNSNLNYNDTKKYHDIWISGVQQIGTNLRYSGALELTTLPHKVIGTNYSRLDYPITTGRFQESKIEYWSESLRILIGRANFFEDTYRSQVFPAPINGDGLSWIFTSNSWSFKHVIESLPAEISSIFPETIYRRLLNYHHLTFQWRNSTFGAGEYYILTGTSIGLDLKRMNPFVPYSRNSHDSYLDIAPGYTGDTDNSLIKLFWEWESTLLDLSANLYIDEFQVDLADRKTNNDALLLNINYQQEFNSISSLNLSGKIEASFSIGNPNFGDHPGPFTGTNSAEYPILEYSPGMLNMTFFKSSLNPTPGCKVSLAAHSESWVNISRLPPELRNQRSALDTLLVQEDSHIIFEYEQNITSLHSTILFATWRSTVSKNLGINAGIQYDYPF